MKQYIFLASDFCKLADFSVSQSPMIRSVSTKFCNNGAKYDTSMKNSQLM